MSREIRVAYVTCDTPAWVGIAANMQRAAEWRPVYWIAEPYARDDLMSRFPGVIVHSRYDAYHMINPPELTGIPVEPLDDQIVRDTAEAQVIALKMMDVMDSMEAFDFNARRRFFLQRLRYWRSIVGAVRPDMAIFGFSPHVVYDYVFYVLARYCGIRTMMFEATFNFALLFAFENHMDGSLEMAERYEQLLEGPGRTVPLPELYERYLDKLRGRYADAMPWYMRDQFASFPKAVANGLYRGDDEERRRRNQWVRLVHRTRAFFGGHRR
jgi:hypothetical protein